MAIEPLISGSNLVFVLSSGAVMLWLLCRSLRSSPQKEAGSLSSQRSMYSVMDKKLHQSQTWENPDGSTEAAF
jgi:hypothetical protein